MFWRFYSQPKHRNIRMESLLRDYERELNPPSSCWEYIKSLFHK